MCDITCKFCDLELGRLLAITDPHVVGEVMVLCSECVKLNVMMPVDGHIVLRQATEAERQEMLLDRDYQRAVFALTRMKAGRN